MPSEIEQQPLFPSDVNIQRSERIESAARTFLKNHHGHHPVHCIGDCDETSCGENALIDALHSGPERSG